MSETGRPPRKSAPASDAVTAGAVMRVSDMVVHPDHALAEAAQRLRDQGLGFAPVADSDEIVGIVTCDALDAAPGAAAPPAVRDRMTSHVPFLYDDDPLGVALAVEQATGCSRFCVVDRNYRLVGLIELDDEIRRRAGAENVPDSPDLARKRIAVTASRATGSPPGRVPLFAVTPTLYLHPPPNAGETR